MKYVAIASFVFFINISMALTNATGLFIFDHSDPDTEWIQSVNEDELANEEYVKNEVGQDSDSWWLGDFIKGLWLFIKAFGMGVIAFSTTLSQFGLEYPFTYLLNACVYLIYFAGIAQFIANRNTKTMG